MTASRLTTVCRCRSVRFVYVVAMFALVGVLTVQRQRSLSIDEIFASPFDASDLKSLDRTLRTVVDVLDRLNVTYFMTSGTLLGSYRHHGRIPWDDDVDLILESSAKRAVWNALTALSPDYGLFLSGRIDRPYHWKFYPRRDGDGRPIVLKPFRWPFVDLLFYLDNDTHVWNESPWFWDELWPRSAVFPLGRRPFDGLWLPAPHDTSTVLSVNFDLDRCVSRSWSHVVDLPMLPGSAVAVPCSTLADRHPFVRDRSSWRHVNGTAYTSETLMVGNRTVGKAVVRSARVS